MTDLPTLRAQRDEARVDLVAGLSLEDWLASSEMGFSKDEAPVVLASRLDTLLRLHAQVTTLENVEKLEARAEFCGLGIRQDILLDAAAFLRATVEGETR